MQLPAPVTAINYNMHPIRNVICVLALSSLPCISLSDNNAIGAYKAGDFETAIPLLQTACAKHPDDPALRAALLSSLVYEGRVDEASDAADAAVADFPKSPDVLAARGVVLSTCVPNASPARKMRCQPSTKSAVLTGRKR
jgi:hypothetical protein